MYFPSYHSNNLFTDVTTAMTFTLKQQLNTAVTAPRYTEFDSLGLHNSLTLSNLLISPSIHPPYYTVAVIEISLENSTWIH